MDFLPRLGRPIRAIARNHRPLPRAGRGRGRGRGGSSTNAVPQVKVPKGFFRETQDERNFRLTVLRTFKCPFQEEGTCKNDSKPHECLFAHPETTGPVTAPTAPSRPAGAKKATDPLKALVIPPEGELREIPPYVCVYSLLNSCYNKNKFFQHRMRSKYAKGGADKGPSAPMDVDEDNDGDDEEEEEMGAAEPTDGPVIDEVKGAKVDVCTSGIHLRTEDLVDLDYFERMNPDLLDQFFGGDRDRECSVCFEKVMAKRLPKNRKFAMLENCAHVFCVACIKEWRTRSMNCPVCRVESKRFATKSRLITDDNEKKKYFGNKKSKSVYGERDAQAQANVRVRQNLDRLAAAEELFNMEFRVDIGGNLMFAPPGASDDDDDDDLFGLAVASDEDDDDASITDQDDMFLDADDYDDYDLMFDDFERDRFDDLERGFGRGGGGGGGGRVGDALAAAAEVPGAILEHVQIMINNGFDWAAPPGGRRAAGGAGRNVMITARRTGGGNVANDAAAAEARGNAARGNAARGRDAARGREAARGNAARPLRNVPRAEEDPIDRAIVRDIGRIIERHERNNRNNNDFEDWGAPRAEPVAAARARRNGPAQNNRRRNDNNNAHNDDDPHDPDNNDHHWVYPNIRGIDLEFDFAEPGGPENRRLERAIIDIVGGGRGGRRARGLPRGGAAARDGAARDGAGRDQGRDANARGNGAARARNDGAAAAAAPRGRRGGNVPENANRNARGGVGGRGAAAAAPTRNNNRGRGAANGGNRGRGRRDF